jgi:Sec-independent protein translocase protein TatA
VACDHDVKDIEKSYSHFKKACSQVEEEEEDEKEEEEEEEEKE